MNEGSLYCGFDYILSGLVLSHVGEKNKCPRQVINLFSKEFSVLMLHVQLINGRL